MALFQKITTHTLFQSTHPTRECDHADLNFNLDQIGFQSTHPTRECDKIEGALRDAKANFNPRTLQESATALVLSSTSSKYLFQSTHPTRECDHGWQRLRGWHTCYFNPRTLQESATLL